jgi:hypothetical protein
VTGTQSSAGGPAQVMLALISTPPLNGRLLAQGLQDIGYLSVGRKGKARSWKHPLSATMLTYREQPSGEIDWQDELDKIERHVRRVLELPQDGADSNE